MRTGTQWQNVVSTISHMCDIVDTLFCHCRSMTLCVIRFISEAVCHRIEHQVCNKILFASGYLFFVCISPSLTAQLI